jgi:flavin-dependent dehydrogenase
MYDICIIGAGPAGSTLARLIGDRYRVLLVDSRELESSVARSRGKVCGGLLAPKAQRELARQGLGVPGDVVLGPQLFAVRTVDVNAGLERLYQRFYINVDREAFDRWLVSLVPSSVERVFGWTARGIEVEDERSLVTFRTGEGGAASVMARLVVGADGARSLVRRVVSGDIGLPPRYSAIQATFTGTASNPYYGAVFDDTVTDFYGWTIPKEGTTLVGAAFPVEADVSELFERFVERTRATGFAFGPEIRRDAAMILRPALPTHIVLGSPHGGVALIGEAAGLISPSSAEGISYALRSARALGRALEPGLLGAVERYRREALPLRLDVLGRMVKSSAIYGPATRRLVMRTGFASIREQPGLASPALREVAL